MKNGQLYHLLDVRNPRRDSQGRNFYNKCSENSRSQIFLRTNIFRKLTLGASENLGRSDDAKRRKNKEDGLKTKKIVFTEEVFITKMALFLV